MHCPHCGHHLTGHHLTATLICAEPPAPVERAKTVQPFPVIPIPQRGEIVSPPREYGTIVTTPQPVFT